MCCNPFNKPGHLSKSKKKKLRLILPWMIEKLPSLEPGGMIFNNCRLQLAQTPVEETPLDESDGDVDDSYTCHQGQLMST